jgi:SAM-dependent methyltransferase
VEGFGTRKSWIQLSNNKRGATVNRRLYSVLIFFGLLFAATSIVTGPQFAKSNLPPQANNFAAPDDPATILSPRPDEKKKDKDAQTKNPKPEDNPEPDVPYWPTPPTVVDKMLEMADVKKGDVVYDLGCGDARILVAAAKKYGVKGLGFDIDPEQVKESLENVKKNKLEDLVTIKKADIFTLDLKDASVVTLYLMPELNVRLMPQLEKLKPGSRIVSHDWDMKGAKPKEVVSMRAKNAMGLERVHKVYLWVVPWEKE